MELKENAKKLYKKSHRHPGFDAETTEKMRATICKMLRKYVQSVKFKMVFEKKEFRDAVLQTLQLEKVDLQKASEAFSKLEQYFLLLHDFPWRKEFHTLKMYGGYVNCHVCAHLAGVENIFRLAGYHDTRSLGVLSLEGVTKDTNLFMDLALESLVGAEECLYLQESIASHGFSPLDALHWHSAGNMPSLPSLPPSRPPSTAAPLHSTAAPLHSAAAPLHSTAAPLHSEYLEPQSNRNVSAGSRTTVESSPAVVRGQGPDAVDLPYVDDEIGSMPYEEGTLDEHMEASLVALRQEGPAGSHTKDRMSSRSGLDEWDYVRSTLPAVPGPYRGTGARPLPMEDDEGIEMEHLQNFAKPAPGVLSSGTTRPLRGMTGSQNNGSDSAYVTDIYFPPSNGSGPYAGSSERSSAMGAPPVSRPVSYAESVFRENNRLQERSQGRHHHPHPFPQHLHPDRDGGVIVRDKVSPVFSRNSSSWPASGLRSAPPLSAPLRPNPALTIEQVALPPSLGIHPSRDIPRCGDSRRVCRRCTLENSPSALTCDACGTALEKTNTQTYV